MSIDLINILLLSLIMKLDKLRHANRIFYNNQLMCNLRFFNKIIIQTRN